MTKEKDKKRDSVAEAIQSKFLEERKIFLWGEVSDRSARDLTEKLLFLESESPREKLPSTLILRGDQLQQGWLFLTQCNLFLRQLQLLLLEWLQVWDLFYYAEQLKECAIYTLILGFSFINP